MTRTQWVLNWPGQVTIAGSQTYWTKEVSEALEASNLSNHLFPQLSQQVGVKGVIICSPHTPHPQDSLVPARAFSCIEPESGLGLYPKSRRSDTPETSVSQPGTSSRDWGSEESSEARQVPLSGWSLREPYPAPSQLCALAPRHTPSSSSSPGSTTWPLKAQVAPHTTGRQMPCVCLHFYFLPCQTSHVTNALPVPLPSQTIGSPQDRAIAPDKSPSSVQRRESLPLA